jgi:dGTPase
MIEGFGAENEGLLNDFVKFDGNKQGFRIVTKLQRNMGDRYGLNLTFTQLAAIIKYPVPVKGGAKGSVFESELDIKERIWTALELEPTERHPLTIVMEAADDIAYCLSDIEDADDKQLLLEADLASIFGALGRLNDRNRRFTLGRTKITRELVAKAADEFVRRLAKAGGARVETSKLLDDDAGTLARLKRVANKRVYSSRLVLTNEVTAFKVLTGMLDAFAPLLRMAESDFSALAARFSRGESIYEGKTSIAVANLTAQLGHLALFPKKHLSVYLDSCKGDSFPEAFHRAHLVLDFVAGMTDEFALNTYRLLSGQRINATAH